jgi:hypothetical protein
MAKPLAKYLITFFVGLVLIRLANGQPPIDRLFLVGYASFVVFMILLTLVMPFIAPHIVSNREFFASMKRRLRGKNQRGS